MLNSLSDVTSAKTHDVITNLEVNMLTSDRLTAETGDTTHPVTRRCTIKMI